MADPVKPRRHVRNAAAVLLAATVVSGFEGMRQYVYRDVVGIPTYCVGETKNPQWGKTYTKQECLDILDGRLREFAAGVEACTKVDLPPKREAALISFAYNLGVGKYCNSGIPGKLAKGDVQGACDELLGYVYADHKVFRGLVNRRQKERELCLAP